MTVLVPTSDHSFYEARVYQEEVILNKKTGCYYEYAGRLQELEEDETLITMSVVR